MSFDSIKRKYDLDERLINFAVTIVALTESLPDTKAANHLGDHLLRSGTAPSLNYGEAKAAVLKRDFLHKMKLCLKELRETFNNLRILNKSGIAKSDDHGFSMIESIIEECNELISIFVASEKTATQKD